MFGFHERRGKFLTSWVTIGFAWSLAHGVILGIYCKHDYSSTRRQRHCAPYPLHVVRSNRDSSETLFFQANSLKV